jgi:hypothetical protein
MTRRESKHAPARRLLATRILCGLALATTAACTESPDDGPGFDHLRGADGSLPMYVLGGQSNMEGNVDGTLFTTLLDQLAAEPNDGLEQQLYDALYQWHMDIGKTSVHTEALELEVARLIAMRDEGLIGPTFAGPLDGAYCSWNGGQIDLLAANGNCGNPFGPELMLGHALDAADASPASFIKVAVGGTTLFTEWRPPMSGGETGPLYLQMRDRIAALATAPDTIHPSCATEDCHWEAFVWFQGENDIWEEANGLEYEQNLTNLIADVRSEVGNPTLPVIIVEIGHWAQVAGPFGQNVVDAQRAVVMKDEHARLVVTDDLSNYYHYDPAAQLIIGRRIAAALQELECGGPGGCGTSSGGEGADTGDPGTDDGFADDSTSAGAGSDDNAGDDDGGVTDDAGAESADSSGAASTDSGAASESGDGGCGCSQRGDGRGRFAWAGLSVVPLLRRRTSPTSRRTHES